MKYRAEIDGLRAIAVITVMFFHAGFKYFHGGYIGVDIFFVISGYLITTIILTELEEGKFSLVLFYERRARRIIPPLFVVMAASLLYAWFWLLPVDMREFSQSLVAVSSFSSNILFWITSGYWDTSNEFKPLLHTWSLAVEEQYYFLFPLFLMLLWKYQKQWIFSSILMLTVISLGMAQWGAYNEPIAAFYLLPTRVWELAIGAGIGYLFLHRNPEIEKILSHKLLKETLSFFGLILIIFAVIIFDEKTPYPSLYTLFPTIGTGLLITFSSSETMAGRLLSFRPLVFIGLISYSAYLWHQPLFAFTRLRNPENTDELVFTALILLSLVLAYFSWLYIEKPFRDKAAINRKSIFTLSLSGSLIFLTVGFSGHLSNGFENRLTDDQKRIMAFNSDETKEIYKKLYREEQCLLSPRQTFTDFSSDCFYSNYANNTIFIWGDSHAAALSYGIRKAHQETAQLTASGCLPLTGYDPISRPYCQEINVYILEKVGELKPNTLILHANWSDPLGGNDLDLRQALIDTILLIRSKSPTTQVIIVGGVPQWMPSLPSVLLRSHIALDDEALVYSGSFETIRSADNILKDAAHFSNSDFISLLDLFCKEKECLSSANIEGNYEPFTWDYGHLTKSASLLTANKLLEIINGQP